MVSAPLKFASFFVSLSVESNWTFFCDTIHCDTMLSNNTEEFFLINFNLGKKKKKTKTLDDQEQLSFIYRATKASEKSSIRGRAIPMMIYIYIYIYIYRKAVADAATT